MAGHEVDHSTLPRVDQQDLLAVEEFIDPEHQERWKHFSETNPDLMRELLVRALHHSGGNPDFGKAIVDDVTWAMGALERALNRQNSTADATTPPDQPAQPTLFEDIDTTNAA